MFAGSTLFFAMDVADIIERLKIILVDNSSLDPDVFRQRMDSADDKTEALEWTGEILFVFMVCLAPYSTCIILMSRFQAHTRRYSRPVEDIFYLLREENFRYRTFPHVAGLYPYVGLQYHIRDYVN